jgi:hypothetical protein
MDMRFGTWNFRSMYRAGSLRTVAEEIYKTIILPCSIWVQNWSLTLREEHRLRGV